MINQLKENWKFVVKDKFMETKFIYIYNETDRVSGICPSGCHLCEEKENLLLLPYEEDYIFKNKKTKIKFHKGVNGYSIESTSLECPCLLENGKCSIYNIRPFDCRSFPVVPKFSIDNISQTDFFFGRPYCPIIKEISSDFVKTIVKCWKSIEEYLPNEWKTLYNKLNEQTYKCDNKILKNSLK